MRTFESNASALPDQVFELHRAVLADLGCGDGRFVRYMRSRGFDARGADISEDFRPTESE